MGDTVHSASVVGAWILYLVLVAIGCWDLWCLSRGRSADTVSAIIRDWAAHYPILPFIAGLLAGHLFFQGR